MTKTGLIFLIGVAATAQNLPNPNYELRSYIGTGSRGDGQPAVETLLDGAYGAAEDAAGNVYISESNAGVIRKVRPNGIIERFAGTGILGNTGSGRPALETDLTHPTVLAIDRDGGLLFYEAQYCRIRKVLTDGTVGDVAGTGRCGGGFSFNDRDRTAFDTDISNVGGIAVDPQGRVVFTETTKHIVRRVDSDGFVRTIAGTGVAGSTGDGDFATAATLNSPVGLAFDPPGNLYIADGVNCRVRKVDTAGYISIGAGATTCAPAGSGFTGTARTPLDRVGAIAFDGANNVLYAGMPRVYRVARIDFNANRTAPFLGNGKVGVGDPVTPLGFPLNDPSGILVSSRYGVLVAADSSSQVYQVQNARSQRFAGMWIQIDSSSTASAAQLKRPGGILLQDGNKMLFTDIGAGLVLRRSDPDAIAMIAGMPYPTGYVTGDNGPATQATLAWPNRVVQRGTGELYISTTTAIRAVDLQGNIRTARNAVSNPTGMVFDPQGRLLYCETDKHQVVALDLGTNRVAVIAGTTNTPGFSGDGGAATAARLNTPLDLAYDSAGNLLILDSGNHRVRKITPDGKIQTVVGNGLPLAYRDITGILATKTGLGQLQGLATDAKGNIYISETVRVNKIAPDGKVTVVTGFLGEDDNGYRSYMDRPLAGAGALAVDSDGRIYISLMQEGRIIVAVPR